MAQKTRRVSHRVAVSTLFSAIALAYGTAAYGGFYPGHIDPGGNGLDIPGFTGDAIFSIDPGCVASNGFHHTNANPPVSGSGCGAASVYSADINLYSVEPGPNAVGPVLGTFSLGEGPGFWPILGVLVVNNQIAGVDTDAMGPELGTGDYAGRNFWLQFVSGACDTGCTDPGSFDDPAYISVDNIDNFSPPGHVTFGHECSVNANGAPVDCTVAQQAPEPGTMGLILGALGGGWLARRRKAKVATA